MSFRTTALAAKGLLYGGGAATLLVLSLSYPYAIVLAILWLVQKPRFVHRHIMPKLFTHVRCTNGACGCLIPLVQRYKLREYNHNRPEHVFRVRDPNGREVLSIDCPKETCKTTIPIQKGTVCKLVRATIIGNAFALSPEESWPGWARSLWRLIRCGKKVDDGVLFPIGLNRHSTCGWLRRLKRLLQRESVRPFVNVPENIYGRHETYFGASGMGKSTLILSKMEWIFGSGLGATVIDPARDLIDDILKIVPEERKDDVLLVRARDRKCPFRINLLETHDEVAEMNLKADMLHALEAVSRSWGENIALQIEIGIETAKLVAGSLKDVFDLFTKQSARDRIISQIDDEELIEFWEKYDRSSNQSRAPVVRKIRSIVKHPILGPMLGAEESNFDPDAIIRDRKIVLVDLNTASNSDEVKIMLGTFLIGMLRGASLRQPKDQRVRHFLIIDEASDFMHPGMNLSNLLSQARKHLLTLVLASQHISQMTDKVKDEIFANAGVIVSFNVDLKDAKVFADRMTDVEPDDITMQNVGECIARVHRDTYFVKTVLPRRVAIDQTQYIETKMHAMNKVDKGEGESDDRLSVQVKAQVVEEAMVCEGVR